MNEEQIQDAVVVNDVPKEGKEPQTKTEDVIAIHPKFRDELVEVLSKVPLTMGNSDSERLYNAYLALKAAPVIQMTYGTSGQ